MWSEVGERAFFGPDMIKAAEEHVEKVTEHLKIARSRQKSYADKRRRPLEFKWEIMCTLRFLLFEVHVGSMFVES